MDQFGLSVSSGMGLPNGAQISSLEDWSNFAKAVQTSTYQTDHANLTGMAALRVESLEPTLRSVVAQDDTLTMFRALKRTPTTSAVHEYMTQTSRGGQFDGMFNSELGQIRQDVGDYKRDVLQIKYMMTGAAISHVASVQSLHGAQLRARENENALVRLSVGVERGIHHGDSRVAPNQFDGIKSTLEQKRSQNVIDLQGLSDANELAKLLFYYKAAVRQQGNYGDITDFVSDAFVQNDLDLSLFPQYRVHLDANPTDLMLGAPVSGIKTSMGNIKTSSSIWLDNNDNSKPKYVQNGNKLPDNPPGAFTAALAANAAPVAGSRWTAGHAGTYYYSFAPIDANGVEGLPTTPASATVAANGSITGTITHNADGKATGIAIYRSTQNPTSAPNLADLRLVARIPVSNGASTTWVDKDIDIPGSSTIELINKKPEAISFIQLLPATQFPLYATSSAVIPWAVLLYGALLLGIPQHHYVLKNYLPSNATWKPYAA